MNQIDLEEEWKYVQQMDQLIDYVLKRICEDPELVECIVGICQEEANDPRCSEKDSRRYRKMIELLADASKEHQF